MPRSTKSKQSSISEWKTSRVKKEETNDIVQFLLPQLKDVGIEKEYCKIDVTTESSGNKRGDIWISLVPQSDRKFEKKIICLIEAKHRNSTTGDIDWRDAMSQGKEKALRQGLKYYVVTNCRSDTRYYNVGNDEEVACDGKILTKPVGFDILRRIQSQVRSDNSSVVYKSSQPTQSVSEAKFRATLQQLANIYRSAGLKKGDERIDPTVSFVVIKYISEKEKEDRTLDPVIKLWNDFEDIAVGKRVGDLKAEFQQNNQLIWGDKSEYRNNIYRDFKDLISFPQKLTSAHFKSIYLELKEYTFHGANFDLYGSIYEEFASQTKKKEFGEFYTRRHITGVVARLLLRNEINPKDLKICDPACGTGGFLTEAFKTLTTNYSTHGKLNRNVIKNLREEVFWGFDNDEKSIARTKLNMFLAGDGHIHMNEVEDSLLEWEQEIGWTENTFDYIMTNPPMGQYEGSAAVENFDFTNEKRYELLFTEKVIRATAPGGEIAIVLNDGALETPSREGFRIKLLKSCDINAIVSLTRFAFAPYTKEKTYLVFMQKKQDGEAEIQKHPIWNYILDYDGFANSDKRFKTKYHDDIPELEELFPDAVDLAKAYSEEGGPFETNRGRFERAVNEREIGESLWGKKCGFVEMSRINDSNYHNLLSEYHLRPLTYEEIDEATFNRRFDEILTEVKKLGENGDERESEEGSGDVAQTL